MAIINLRDFYPFYMQDTIIEVSDEVAAALAEAERMERNYIRRMFYNKAHYSLDAEDGIETSAVAVIGNYIITPETAMCMMESHCGLCRALNSLPEIQGRRIEAHYLLGQSRKEIAEAEGVSESSVNESIKRGLRAMKKFLNEN